VGDQVGHGRPGIVRGEQLRPDEQEAGQAGEREAEIEESGATSVSLTL
jgi:hypothetical protein